MVVGQLGSVLAHVEEPVVGERRAHLVRRADGAPVDSAALHLVVCDVYAGEHALAQCGGRADAGYVDPIELVVVEGDEDEGSGRAGGRLSFGTSRCPTCLAGRHGRRRLHL
jgi:hypothetical protein